MLEISYRRLFTEWDGFLRGVPPDSFSTSFTKGTLAVEFVNARLYGSRIRRSCTLAYTPNRLFTAGDKFCIGDVFQKGLDDPSILKSLIWRIQVDKYYDIFFSSSLPVHGHRIPQDFPPDLARDLIQEFCPKPSSKILDPYHGWGGRALGFLLADNASYYEAYDVSEKTQVGVLEMINDLRPLAKGVKETFLKLCPFEDATIPESLFDFALTSPPYYDVEKYDGDLQSWKRYDSFNAWVAGFYKPMLCKVAFGLKPGCVFALNVASHSYPLTMTAIKLAPSCGFTYVETRPTNMRSNNSEDEDKEVVIILRKK